MPPKRINDSRFAIRNENVTEIICIENPAHGTRTETGPTGLSNLNAKTHLERTRRQTGSRGDTPTIGIKLEFSFFAPVWSF